jgi:hypothetical protein
MSLSDITKDGSLVGAGFPRPPIAEAGGTTSASLVGAGLHGARRVSRPRAAGEPIPETDT